MPQQLQKCLNEVGNELQGWRWDPESKCIYHYKTIDKHNLRFSTGVKFEKPEQDAVAKIPNAILNKAIREANLEISRRLKSEESSKSVKPLLREIIAKIIKRYEAKPNPTYKKNHTLNSVRSSFAKLDQYWGPLFPDQITSEGWDEFQDWWDLQYAGFNSFNVTKHMRILRNECIERGYLSLKPKIIDRNKKVQRLKRNKKKDWVYTNQEIFDLDQKGCATDQERIVVRFGYQNAFRITDALSIKWSQLYLGRKVAIYKFQGEDKAETYNGAPITDELRELLNNHPKTQGSDFVFPQRSNYLKHITPQGFDFEAIKTRAGVTRGTFHALRHFRLSTDFKNHKFTTIQVCLLRRISLREAFENYVHADQGDMELLQNAGSLSTIKESLGV